MRHLHCPAISPSPVWPLVVVTTVLNCGFWFFADSHAAWKALPLAVGVIVAAAIGGVVELARARSNGRKAIWDAYADRELERAATRPHNLGNLPSNGD